MPCIVHGARNPDLVYTRVVSIGAIRVLCALPEKHGNIMTREIIATNNAPGAIGAYSQAVKAGNTVYVSGQIPLLPATMEVVDGDVVAQIRQVFENLSAVCEAAGGGLSDIVKLTVYLTDLKDFGHVNEVMADFFKEPYPARAAIGVAQLPKEVPVEVDAIMVLG